MAYTDITALNLGNTLTIAFSEGIRQNLSLDYPEFELVQSIKEDSGAPRSFKYMMQTTLGPSSIQYRDPGTRYAFPDEQQTEQTEATAVYKELAATVSFEQNLYERLMETKDKYAADRLKTEVESKNAATRRQICMDFYGDGTGALATITSVSISGGLAVVQLANSSTSRGFAGNMQFGEYLTNHDTDGTAGAVPTLSSGTFSHFKVEAKNANINANTVTLRAMNSSNAPLVISSWSPTAGELLYKKGQPTKPDVSGAISDYGTVSQAICGLDSLISNDGRTVHGLAMSGALAGTVSDRSAAQIDVDAIEEAMNDVKNAVGKGRYKWPKATMNRYVRSAFIEGRETDRRFVSVTDHTRGVQKFVYEHDGDSIELQGAEFCPYNRIYILPEGKIEGHKVLSYHGMDFKAAKTPGGNPWHLAPSGNSYMNLMLMFLSGNGVITNNHPASCVKITNFTV